MNSEKKFLKAYGDAFYDVQLLGVFYRNLYLLTYEEMLVKMSKRHYDFKSLAEQFFFKLLLFLNEWSYWYQIGLKLKLICSSFKKCKEGNFSLMVYHIGHEKHWPLDENLDQELSHSSEIDSKHQLNILSQIFPKTTSK